MADSQISALTAASAPVDADLLLAIQSATPKKLTALQLKTYANTAPVVAAGTASANTWPVYTAGTLLTSAVAGALEMDANCFYLTTDAGNRGVVDVVHFIRQHADRAAFSNDTNFQAIFDSVTNGTLTLETGLYAFETMIQCKGMSVTSGNLKWSLLGAGGATLAAILQHFVGADGAVDAALTGSAASVVAAASTAGSLMAASTGATCTFQGRGMFECTGAGSIIPSVAQTTATTTAVITAGSYFRIRRIGASGVLSVGQWT